MNRADSQRRTANGRAPVVLLFILLGVANAAAWIWAAIAFRHYPVLLGTAMLAYGLGLRHAIDADHIAAIDNVTRKLVADGERPIGVGLFFSLGHSTIVVAASIAIAATASMLTGPLAEFRQVGSTIGTIVSASFLIVIAVMNLYILASVYRAFHRARAGELPGDGDLDALLSGGGMLARVFRPLFAMVRRSWHMYPVGLLFGLGFDTATEIALLGISAVEASKGLSFWSILVFPALFTAGMALVDSADSVLMVGAYGWAARSPMRKLYYNMTITFVSVVAALVVGGVEALGLVARRIGLTGGVWKGIAGLNENFGNIGYLIIGVFIVSWVVSAAVYRLKGYHQLDAA
ncbi:MAG TPA: HoxN/HupN/NixA family nickel/cobalt transporter [Gemmatimonadaceae bacterium]|nr:HoxN/HupN/NixA family nickel/cobalt transporter [Gemmatimonadaceae bacterium]